MQKAVITGGLGFVGSVLADVLLQNGYTVKIFTRKAPRHLPENPALEIVRVDYDDISSLAQEIEGAQIVFHLAAAIFAYNFEEFSRANTVLTENMVSAVNRTKSVESFVYLSSQAAAGPCEYKDNPKTEEDIPSPISDYGQTKYDAEGALKNLPPQVRGVILRAPIVYGRQNAGASKLASWVKKGIMVNAGGGEGTHFNFIYVDDLAKALFTAAVLPSAAGGVFFVGENTSYSWGYFINSMADAMGVSRPFIFTLPAPLLEIAAFIYEILSRLFKFTPALNYDKVKEASVKGHWVCNTSKWQALTGQDFTPLAEGLKKSFNGN